MLRRQSSATTSARALSVVSTDTPTDTRDQPDTFTIRPNFAKKYIGTIYFIIENNTFNINLNH